MLMHRQLAVSKVLRNQLGAWGYEVVDTPTASEPPALRLGLVEASAVEDVRAFAQSHPALPLIAVASVRRPFDIFDAMRHGAWTCVVLQDIHAIRDAVGSHRPSPGDIDPLRQTIARVLEAHESGGPSLAAVSGDMREHLATVRALSKGVGDRINNPLTIVKSAVESIGYALADMKPSADDLERIGEIKAAVTGCGPAIERLLAVSQGLRAFALPMNAALGNLDIVRTVREVAPGCELAGPENARVFANEKAVREALTAVLANATESYASGVTERPVVVTVTVAKPSLTLEITDRGGGMTEDVLARVFEPFFSHGKGPAALGLGLTLARERINAMNGEIELSSTAGAGTTVRVRLPVGV